MRMESQGDNCPVFIIDYYSKGWDFVRIVVCFVTVDNDQDSMRKEFCIRMICVICNPKDLSVTIDYTE